MFTYLFWRLAFERAFKTFLQTLVALLSINGIGLLDAPWPTALSAAGMAALLSLLTSMASEPLGERNNPSLLRSGPLVSQPELVSEPEPVSQPEPKTSVPA
ncbi:MAG: holin [Pseudonocardiaceae bacterium]